MVFDAERSVVRRLDARDIRNWAAASYHPRDARRKARLTAAKTRPATSPKGAGPLAQWDSGSEQTIPSPPNSRKACAGTLPPSHTVRSTMAPTGIGIPTGACAAAAPIVTPIRDEISNPTMRREARPGQMSLWNAGSSDLPTLSKEVADAYRSKLGATSNGQHPSSHLLPRQLYGILAGNRRTSFTVIGDVPNRNCGDMEPSLKVRSDH